MHASKMFCQGVSLVYASEHAMLEIEFVLSSVLSM